MRRKNMRKSNGFNWYGLRQRFSIRKYHFGAASVLLGTALVFGNGATAQASDVDNTTEVVVKEEATAESDTEKENKETAVSSEKTAVSAEEKVVAAQPVVTAETPKERTAATNYKVNYTDVDTNAVVFTDPKSVNKQTTKPTTEKEVFEVTEKANLTVPNLAGYRLADNQAETVTANVVEKESKTNVLNFNVKKEADVAPVVEEGTRAYSAEIGYTYDTRDQAQANGVFTAPTGKSYKQLGTDPTHRIYVEGFQVKPGTPEKVSTNNEPAATGGRTDLPLSAEEAQKLSDEAKMWRGKPRPTGKDIGSTNYGAGGAYEFLASEIYGYLYEQGKHYVYLQDISKRFKLSDEAIAAGYRITFENGPAVPPQRTSAVKTATDGVWFQNWIPGTMYNVKSDTVEGYVAANIQNGVYDMRYYINVVDKNGASQIVVFDNLAAGWMGWQDTTPPTVEGGAKEVTVGDPYDYNIQFRDNEGMAEDTTANYTANGAPIKGGAKTEKPLDRKSKFEFTAKDGTRLAISGATPQIVTAHTSVAGIATDGPTGDSLPGGKYTLTTGKIDGNATTAGIFTLAVVAKDYNNATKNSPNDQWDAMGQEAHENVTITVRPKVTVQNVEAYATAVPIAISHGASTAEVTMPDGTVTKLAVKDGNWVVADGTTNTAVTAGQVLAPETAGESNIVLPVTSDATQYVGIDSIAVTATSEKVRADIVREIYTVTDAAGVKHKATFNSATGKFELPDDEAYILTKNADGTSSTLTEKRVYTNIAPNGDTELIVYEFTRTWDATSDAATLVDQIAEVRTKGKVTAVGAVTRTVTPVKKAQTAPDAEGVYIAVTYDPVAKTWTATDGSNVTAVAKGEGWDITTDSGFKGYVTRRSAVGVNRGSIQNAKPEGTSSDYESTKGTSVDLLKAPEAKVAFTDVIDDKAADPESEKYVTSITAVAADGTVKEFNSAKDEEAAFIAAETKAAEKTEAVAQAIETANEAQAELSRKQELLDRATRAVEVAEKSLDKLKLKTVSTTAYNLALEKLNDLKAKAEAGKGDIAAAEAALAAARAAIDPAKQAALAAEAEVEAARTALKAASAALEGEVTAYTLSTIGVYKVTVRTVDSNGIVTTPTVGGTESGEVTEDAVAETTYYIKVTEPQVSAGAKDVNQTENLENSFVTPEAKTAGATATNYTLTDPATGNKSTTVTTDEGTYTIDPTTGVVTFDPKPEFVGTAKPITVNAMVTNPIDGTTTPKEVSAQYTPTVYGLETKPDTTKGLPNKPQTSISGAERFKSLNTDANTYADGKTYADGTAEKVVDLTKAEYTLKGADATGAVVVPGEGKYTIDPKTGVVTFQPEPTFTGVAKTPVTVQVSVPAVDSEGNTITVTAEDTYTPEVTNLKPGAVPAETKASQGDAQTTDAKALFKPGKEKDANQANPENATLTDGNDVDEEEPIVPESIKLLGTDGQPVDAGVAVPAMKDGKQVGTYTMNADGTVTFQPNPDFVGTPEPAKIEAKDVSGDRVETTYTPTVTPVTSVGENKTSKGMPGETQKGTPTFTDKGEDGLTIGDGYDATDVKSKKYSLEGAADDGSVTTDEGKYTINPDTGEVTFVPAPGFVGVAQKPVTVKQTITIVGDDGKEAPITATATYTPEVINLKPKAENTESKGSQGDAQVKTKEEVAALFKPGQEKDANGFNAENADKTDGDETDEVEPINPDTIRLQGADGNPVEPGTKVPAVDATGKEVGYYVQDPATGTVTFQPNPDFVGKPVPAKIEAKDTSGDKVVAEYTPEVTPITVTPTPAETKGMAGETQKGTPTFEIKGEDGSTYDDADIKSKTYAFEGGELTKKVDGEGEYTINPDTGEVTFVPEATFVGKAKPMPVFQTATVVGDDGKETPIVTESSYTPEVINLKPKAEPATTSGSQGDAQTQDAKSLFKPGKEKDLNGVNAENADKTDGDETDEEEPIVPESIKLVDPVTNKPVEAGTPVEVTKDGKVVGTYTMSPEGVITFQPKPDFTGEAPAVTVRATDLSGDEVTTTYTPTVTPIETKGEDKTSKGFAGETQTGTPTFTNSGKEGFDPEDIKEKTYAFEDGTTTKKVDGEGEYTIDPNTGKVTFVPEKTFTGVAKGVTVKETLTVVGDNGETTPIETTAKYTPEVVNLTPTAEPATTTGSQGDKQTQDAKSLFTPGKEDATDPTKTDEDGTPDETEAIDPATIKLVGPNGPVEAGTPVPATKDGKEVGTYVMDENGVITFQPNADFVGTPDPVTIEAKDISGDRVETTYTPTVTPITTSSTDATSINVQGQPQKGKPTFDATGAEGFDPTDVKSKEYSFEGGELTKTVPGEGSYTIDPASGEVTFTPEPQFTGKATPMPVVEKLTVVGDDGKEAVIETKATYTPEVTPVKPTATDVTSIDGQGVTQTGTPTFEGGHELVPIDETVPATFEDGSTTKVVPGEGTYTVDPSGKVTFVPEPQFTGKTQGVTVKRVDKNGTPAFGKYTPEVTPVTPTADKKETTDIQGATQEGTPEFKGGHPLVPIDETVPATFEDGSTTKVVPGEGTYTVAPDGTVTFVPEKTFTGKGTGVNVKRVDKNGTPVLGNYTPNVTPVTPTADKKETTDIQGATQEGTPEFKGGHPNVPIDETVPATFEDGSTTKVIPGEGTYTVTPDGKVTFVPEKTFTGKGTGVNVKRVDKNGTPVLGNYTPNVTPVTPKATEVTSSGKPGETQEGTPTFEGGHPNVPIDETVPATFEDGSTTKVVPGEGTYTVSPDGKVTFTPEPNFTGVAKGVNVKRVDINGTPAIGKYTPEVLPVITSFVDEDGNVISPNEDGTQPNKDIPGYEFTGKTTTDANGNTIHVYRKVPTPTTSTPVDKVITSFVDEDGNVISPSEDGTQPNKDIPGYEFTGKTIVDANGNTIHIYKKKVNPAPKAEEEPVYTTGTLPKTGVENTDATSVAGLVMVMGALGLAGKRRKRKEQ